MRRLKVFESAMTLCLAIGVNLTGMYIAFTVAIGMYGFFARQYIFIDEPVFLIIIAVQLICMAGSVCKYCIDNILGSVRDEFHNKDIDS